MYSEAALNKHLPSEQSAMLTPSFSSSSPAVLPKKLVSGEEFPVAVSPTVARYLSFQPCLCQGGFNSFLIPTAAWLPACLLPPAGKTALRLCQGALKLPGRCRARFTLPPPKGTVVRVAAECLGEQAASQYVPTGQN